MLLNTHSYYSLRYGTLSIEQLIDAMKAYGYDSAVLTDINNSTGVLEYIKTCREKNFNGLSGMEFRNGNELLYIGIAKNETGFEALNRYRTEYTLEKKELPALAPQMEHTFFIYSFESPTPSALRENEYIGIKPSQLNKLRIQKGAHEKYVIWQPITFKDKEDYRLHCQLRAIDNNLLLSC